MVRKYKKKFTVVKPMWEQHRRFEIGDVIELLDERAKQLGKQFLVSGVKKIQLKKKDDSSRKKQRRESTRHLLNPRPTT